MGESELINFLRHTKFHILLVGTPKSEIEPLQAQWLNCNYNVHDPCQMEGHEMGA